MYLTREDANRLLDFATDYQVCGACVYARNMDDAAYPYPKCPYHLGGLTAEAEVVAEIREALQTDRPIPFGNRVLCLDESQTIQPVGEATTGKYS